MLNLLLSLSISSDCHLAVYVLSGDTDGFDGQEEIAGAVLKPDSLHMSKNLKKILSGIASIIDITKWVTKQKQRGDINLLTDLPIFVNLKKNMANENLSPL
jgi:hypothetical protein